MIKVLLFDFMETLGSAADGFRQAEKDVERKIFAHAAPGDWQAFLEVYRRQRKRFHAESCFSRRVIWRQVYANLGRACDDSLLDLWEDEYWATVEASMRLFPETLSVLAGLEPRYRLGMVTNQQSQSGSRALSFGAFAEVKPYFEAVVVGGEGGIRAKPAPDAFLEALRRLEARPQEAVYIGDDWETDIRGARAAGMRPVWVRHDSVRRNWPAGDGQVTTIRSLQPLLWVEALLADGAGGP